MATPTNPDRKLSTFESLPLEIRRKVYDELLKADHIRQPPNGLMICHYKFETAILVVNKKIHSEAHNTLYYDNRFIVVSTNMDCFHACMEDHEVAAIACTKPKAVALFDNHVLRLHVRLSDAGYQVNKALKTCLLVAGELERFVRMIRILMGFTVMTNFKFTFRVEKGSSNSPTSHATLVDQKMTLEPFRRLRLHQKHLKLTGPIDSTYANSLTRSMVPVVRWLRGFAWEKYVLLFSMTKSGDQAFFLGKFKLARDRYIAGFNTWKRLYEQDPESYAQDESIAALEDRVNSINRANISLASLRCQDWELVLKDTEDLEQAMAPTRVLHTTLEMSMLHHIRAIAASKQGMNSVAFKHLEKALALNPSSRLLQSHINITQSQTRIKERSHDAQSKDPQKTTGTIYSTESLEQLNMLAQMPEHRLDTWENIEIERCVLQHFGLSGDLFEEIKDHFTYRGDQLEEVKGTAIVRIKEITEIVHELEKALINVEAREKHSIWLAEGGKIRWFCGDGRSATAISIR